jgi:hypothetical protein
MRLCILALIFTLTPALVNAGTFCVAGPGLTPQCLYEDITTCQRAATSSAQGCVVNPQAALHLSGQQPYCVVNAQRVGLCNYTDRSQCSAEAARAGSICTERIIAGEANPYRYDLRLQN